MKEKLLIVEDDKQEAELLKERVKNVADKNTEILPVAKSASEAFKAARRGDIAYCALDLGMPEVAGGKIVGFDGQCRLGFDVLKEILKNNPYAEVRIVSRHTDLEEITRRLAREFRSEPRVLGVESKLKDDYLSKIADDLMGFGQLTPVLEALALRVIHPLERRLARKLWKIANIDWKWPTPKIVLRGESQTGKDRWADALVILRNERLPNPRRVPKAACDLGHMRSEGDSPVIKLFGTENYQNIPSRPGIFEQATGHKANNRVDFELSNFAILSELGNLPSNCQSLLLEVLADGRVTRAGTGGQSRSVGCGFIFTTNAKLEERVVSSELAQEGEFREDLFKRLRHSADSSWLFVPSFAEMGFEAFMEHLRAALSHAKAKAEIAPVVEELLREEIGGGGMLSQLSISNIVSTFVRSGNSRLSADHISGVLSRFRISENAPSATAKGVPANIRSQVDGSPFDPIKQPLTSAEEKFRAEIQILFGNRIDLFHARPFKTYVQGLDDTAKAAFKLSFENIFELSSADKTEKAAIWPAIGRIFNYRGKGGIRRPQSLEIYSAQVGEWLRGQVFRGRQ